MAEGTTVNQVESEKIEPDEVDNKANPNEGLVVNLMESEKIDPGVVDNEANPNEGLTFNLVESEEIEPEDVDNEANPNEGLTVNLVESEEIEQEDVDNKENSNEGLVVNLVESEKIKPEDVDNEANPNEGITNLVESEKIELEGVDNEANPNEGLTVNLVESEKIELEDVDNEADPNEGLTVNLVESEKIEPENDDNKANSNEGLTVNLLEYEKIESADVDNKANPNEGLIITKGPPKILSRYLSRPKGSCHDLCKYGIQHATEAKPWKTQKKRVTTKERETKVPGENLTSLAGTKKSGRSSNPSPPSSKFDGSSYPVDTKEVTNEKTVTSSEKNSTPEETDVPMEHNNSDISQATSGPSSLLVKECSKSQTKRELVKNKVGFGSSSRKDTEIRSNHKRTSSTGGKEKSTPPSSLFSSKQIVKKPSSSGAKTDKNLTGVSSLEEVKPELASNGNSPVKNFHVTEPTTANLSEEPNLARDATKSPSPSGDKSLKRTSKKTGKSGVSASSRKGLRHVGHGTTSVALSHLSPGNKGKINMQHKTRSVSRSSSALSSVSTSNSSFKKQYGSTSKPNKPGHGNNQGENVKVGYKIRPKRTTIVGAGNKVIPPRKLTFRRGKVIEIQPESNNIARRLKFRPARLLGDDIRREVNGTRERISTNEEVDGGEVNAANIKTDRFAGKHHTVEGGKNRSIGRRVGVDRSKVCGSKSGSEKVVLRRQNVEGKKQNPRLYNNVIEETASKLAELRKSKVKALVGAFETVISLDSPREAAPTEVTTAC